LVVYGGKRQLPHDMYAKCNRVSRDRRGRVVIVLVFLLFPVLYC
jgi:hypothetical protein